jgi:glucose uptake protein GlcU
MRNFITHEWFTIFTIIGLFAIVAAKFVNTLRFNDFLNVIGNSKYLKIYAKDQKFIDQFDSFLFINLALSLSIFIYFSYSIFIAPIPFELISFLKLLFAVSTIIIIKTLLERLIGSLFEIDSLIDHYLFQKTTFKNYSGIIFLIANLFLLYANKHANIAIIVGFSLICLINLIGFITSFKTYQKLINPNFFYFLLYLCALEFGPYVLLYKVITEYNA